MNFGSAICQVREAASPTDTLMSLNLSRNAVARERALGFLADAERALEDCFPCLARDVIVSETQAAEHNRSIVKAGNALHASRGQTCRHLRDAQMAFLHPSRSLTWPLATQAATLMGRENLTSLLWSTNRTRVKLPNRKMSVFPLWYRELKSLLLLHHLDRNRWLSSRMLELLKMLTEVFVS